MAENVSICDIDPELKEKIKKFRFRKETNNAAIIMKIDKNKRMVVLDEEFEDMTLDELQDELPSGQPRYLVYSYAHSHDDGRKSYPLCFIFISPAGGKPEQNMMYSGSMKSLVAEVQLTKVFELRSVDDLTEEWLQEKLSFFN